MQVESDAKTATFTTPIGKVVVQVSEDVVTHEPVLTVSAYPDNEGVKMTAAEYVGHVYLKLYYPRPPTEGANNG